MRKGVRPVIPFPIRWMGNGWRVHRVDAPSIIWFDGEKCWYKDGKRHREDGPAIEYANGEKCWYLNGENISEEDWERRMGR